MPLAARVSLVIAAAAALLACGHSSTPTPTPSAGTGSATASASGSDPAAGSGSAVAATDTAAFPPIDTACNVDADCTTTGRWRTCCGDCELKYSSNAYVEKVNAYCDAHPPTQCPPMGCSWGMATVHCVDHVCRDQPREPRKPRPPKTTP